jgi:transcription initiation factor IIE alpha subunit
MIIDLVQQYYPDACVSILSAVFVLFDEKIMQQKGEKDGDDDERVVEDYPRIKDKLSSIQISRADLLKTLSSIDETKAIDSCDVMAYLTMLSNEEGGVPIILTRTTRMTDSYDDDMYSVNFGPLQEFIKWRHIEAILMERYGDRSSRIFRLLRHVGRLTEKQIVEKTMISAKEVRSRLGILMNEKWVHLQEIPKTADRDPSRCIYLWHIRGKQLMMTVKLMLLKGLVNLRERKEAELESKRTITLCKNTETIQEISSLSSCNLSLAGQQQLEELTRMKTRFELAELRLSRVYFLFTE